jgi:hypothetical protein
MMSEVINRYWVHFTQFDVSKSTIVWAEAPQDAVRVVHFQYPCSLGVKVYSGDNVTLLHSDKNNGPGTVYIVDFKNRCLVTTVTPIKAPGAA